MTFFNLETDVYEKQIFEDLLFMKVDMIIVKKKGKGGKR